MKSQQPPINQADVAGFISGYYGVPPGHPGILKLLEVVYPDIQQASARDTGSWKSAAPSVIAKYDSMAKEWGLSQSQTERDQATLRTANQTDAAFASALGRLGTHGLREYQRSHMLDAGDGGARGHSSASYARETPLSGTGAVAFAKELGINPAYASFFTGGSRDMQNALREAINGGKPIADDKIKSMHDVGMVLGAIRAGKLKPDDPSIPPSVKKIIEDMKSKGIDPTTADPSEIKKYLKDNPKALEAARKQDVTDQNNASNLTPEQKQTKVNEKKPDTAKPKPKAASAVVAPSTSL